MCLTLSRNHLFIVRSSWLFSLANKHHLKNCPYSTQGLVKVSIIWSWFWSNVHFGPVDNQKKLSSMELWLQGLYSLPELPLFSLSHWLVCTSALVYSSRERVINVFMFQHCLTQKKHLSPHSTLPTLYYQSPLTSSTPFFWCIDNTRECAEAVLKVSRLSCCQEVLNLLHKWQTKSELG